MFTNCYGLTICILLATILCLLLKFLTLKELPPPHSDKLKTLVRANLSEQQTPVKMNRNFIPKYMLDLYEESRVLAERDIFVLRKHPEVVKSIIPINVESIETESLEETFESEHLLIFQIPFPNEDEIFETAELRILTIVDPNNNSGSKRIVHISYIDPVEHKIKHLDRKYIHHTNNTWISFNLTSQVRYPELRLLIAILKPEPEYSNFRLSISEQNYPLLLLSYSTATQRRPKRNTLEEEYYEEETNQLWNNAEAATKRMRRMRNLCRRQSLYINFADINYDTWIVQPEGYEAYQCSGKCFYPVADHLSPTKHAMIQALMHSIKPRHAPRTCCVPTKLGSISILYYDSHGVLTYRFGYQDMVVLECGCR